MNVTQTSKDAYFNKKYQDTRIRQRDRIEDYLIDHPNGAIREDIGYYTNISVNAMCGRLRELEEDGDVIKTEMLQKSDNDCDCHVYVHKRHYKTHMGKAGKKAEPIDRKQFRRYEWLLKEFANEGDIRAKTLLVKYGVL